ncbi:MAG TPA: LamG domain-containing protein, partial [Verrucomicrobiae bacterium]
MLLAPAIVVAQTNSPGEALVFNGTNEYVNLGAPSSFNAYPFTIMAWIKTTSTNLCGVACKYYSASFNGYQLLLNNGHIQAWYFNGSGGGTYYNKGAMDGGLVNDGAWHHVALSVDGSGARLCKDGVEVDSEVWTGTPSAPTTSQGLYLGYYPGIPTAGVTGYYTGEIDEVSLWNVGLLPSQIQTYMSRSLTG